MTKAVWFDSENEAWVRDGVYVRCGHRRPCDCYHHEGETPTAAIRAQYEYDQITTMLAGRAADKRKADWADNINAYSETPFWASRFG